MYEVTSGRERYYIRNHDVASRAGSSRKMMSLISNRCNGNDHKTAKVVSKTVGPLYSVIRMTLNESANRYIRSLKFNVTTKFHKIIRFSQFSRSLFINKGP